MKLFIDTNIFIEYFEKRQHFESVRMLFIPQQTTPQTVPKTQQSPPGYLFYKSQ